MKHHLLEHVQQNSEVLRLPGGLPDTVLRQLFIARPARHELAIQAPGGLAKAFESAPQQFRRLFLFDRADILNSHKRKPVSCVAAHRPPPFSSGCNSVAPAAWQPGGQ